MAGFPEIKILIYDTLQNAELEKENLISLFHEQTRSKDDLWHFKE